MYEVCMKYVWNIEKDMPDENLWNEHQELEEVVAIIRKDWIYCDNFTIIFFWIRPRGQVGKCHPCCLMWKNAGKFTWDRLRKTSIRHQQVKENFN